MILKQIFLTGVSVLMLYCIYYFITLKLLGFDNMVIQMLNKIQGEETKAKALGVALSYLVIIFEIYYFVIRPRLSLFDAFLLGFASFGIYDFTNCALLNNCSLKIALMDSIWGGTMFLLTNLIVSKLSKKKYIESQDVSQIGNKMVESSTKKESSENKLTTELLEIKFIESQYVSEMGHKMLESTMKKESSKNNQATESPEKKWTGYNSDLGLQPSLNVDQKNFNLLMKIPKIEFF